MPRMAATSCKRLSSRPPWSAGSRSTALPSSRSHFGRRYRPYSPNQEGDTVMAKQTEFFEIPYKEGSLDAKAAELIKFAVNLAIGHEHGAKLHLGRARECGASEDEVWETVVYAMRPVAAQVRNFAKAIVAG
ncbi:MAG: carboxymuconolactone decarboxylase family protein [Deltaproteobacteria bacterium]|nr:MAG: carboxymuconolactone decarboxylase family protein [Deltaproteobacteria bacterium]